MRGIVLHVLKYSDKNSIAHIYTDVRGRMSFLIPQGNTRSARMRNATFMPLSVIQRNHPAPGALSMDTRKGAKSLRLSTTRSP